MNRPQTGKLTQSTIPWIVDDDIVTRLSGLKLVLIICIIFEEMDRFKTRYRSRIGSGLVNIRVTQFLRCFVVAVIVVTETVQKEKGNKWNELEMKSLVVHIRLVNHHHYTSQSINLVYLVSTNDRANDRIQSAVIEV